MDGGAFITGRLLYFDPEEGAYYPMPATPIRVTVFDEYEGRVVAEYAYGNTGSDGSFSVPCEAEPSGYTTYTSTFYLTNGDINVLPNVASSVGGSCRHVGDIVASAGAPASTWSKMLPTVQASRALLSRSRGLVTIQYDPSVAGSWYSRNTDRITIGTQGVYGYWGRFTIAHEYGHAVHQAALGGGPSTSSACDVHQLDSVEDLTCAFVEGFADWHGFLAGTTTVYLATLEANGWYSVGDGSRIEGAVAAFLYDLWDAPTSGGSQPEPHDTAQLPGSYIADIVRTCEVLTTGVWGRASGVDHLVYCFERQVDPAVTGSGVYFPSRFIDPTQQRESAIEPGSWSQASVRRAWRRNLYGE